MIRVFDPDVGEEEIEAVVAALRRGEISGSFGEAIPQLEQAFAEYCGCHFGVSVTSGTTALQLAVAAAGVGPGDEVLVSACTNIATALAVVHNGAIPIPVDSEAATWNLDLELIDSLITSRTRAIIPVHLFGHPVDMDRLCQIADRHNLVVIEDAAEAHGATVRDRKVGGFGLMGCFSFYANKVITTGEGGMVTTSDADVAERLALLRNLAFAEPRFVHQVAGFNFRMTGYQAAMGLAQFAKIERIIEEKRSVADRYNQRLADIAGLQLPIEAEWARSVYWMYAVRVEPEFGISRDELMHALADDGIETRTFFCPMNQQPCLLGIEGFRDAPCPVADDLWKTGLYLPSSRSLTEDQIETVVSSIKWARE